MNPRQAIERIIHSTAALIVVVILAGLTVTYWAWDSSVNSAKEAVQNSTAQKVETFEKFLDERLISYKNILQGGVGLFDANSGVVSRDQWKLFADSYDFSQRFPAIEAFGYVESFSAAGLDEHQNRIRSQGLPNYRVIPPIPMDTYAAVVYIEPQTPASPIGYNMLSEPSSAKVATQAYESGEVAISPILDLKENSQKGFLMVYPVYAHPEQELELKKQSIRGYTYLAIDLNDMINLAKKQTAMNNLEFAISESSDPSNQNYIYKTKGFVPGNRESNVQMLPILDKDWTIYSEVDKQSIVYKQAKSRPLIVLASGIAVTLMIAFFLRQTIWFRGREVEYEKQLELQKSMDGLLSLASHQLRTPATGVKQYLGMVLQGYVGKVDKKQNDLLQRAYASNERQLEIVNQILHISRIEAGSLELTPERVDLGVITREVVKEQRKTIKNKGQTIKVTTKKPLPKLQGDPIYLSMVIENLVSNASKYTFDKGKISVHVYAKSGNIILEVSDTGVGIEQKDMGKLFNKFSRIHNELSISSGGTGIGLYLSKLIVQLHGGYIETLSRKGLGTTFRVILPKRPKTEL